MSEPHMVIDKIVTDQPRIEAWIRSLSLSRFRHVALVLLLDIVLTGVQFGHFTSLDLQEPPRIVSSYTHLLDRRSKNKLDFDAKEFIGSAVEGAKRMPTQINDYTNAKVGTYMIVWIDSAGFTRILA